MISKEQLKHIDADALWQEKELHCDLARVEEMIIEQYANGLDEAVILFTHKFSDIILDKLEEGGYTYNAEQISKLDTGIDFYKVMLK